MSVTIEMPKLSDTMSVGTVVKWHKNEGDMVVNGDTLAEIETDKATMELENFEDGILLKILVEEGEEAPIGSPLALVGEEGEGVNAPEAKAAVASPEPAEGTVENPVLENSGKDVEQVVAAVDHLPNEDTVTDFDSPESKYDLREQDAAPSGNHIRISPIARKIASEKNLDLSQIKGSGPFGRIVKKDVIDIEITHNKTMATQPQGIESELSQSFSSKSSSVQNGLLTSRAVPLSGIRSVIAKRLSESKSTIPHFYLQREINIKPLLDTRIALNENAERKSTLSASSFNKLTLNDLILKACAESIKWHPEINTSWGENEIIFHDSVELAFGVAIEGGLLTPVIRKADTLSLTDISLEAKKLIALARSKKLLPEAMSGSTFTVTNLGMYGVDFFSGIINPPNAAILSVGSSKKKPVLDKCGKIVAGETLTLGLSCDHRLVDGAIGASFLYSLANNLENPACMLV